MPQVTQYPRMPRWEYWKPLPPTSADVQEEGPEINPMSLEVDEQPTEQTQQTQQSGSMF